MLGMTLRRLGAGRRLAAPLRARRARLASPPIGDHPLRPEAEPEPDDAGGRRIALNMASMAARATTRACSSRSTSALPDVEALLDDVYARAGR